MRYPTTATVIPTMSGTEMSRGTTMPVSRHYSWHTGMNTADTTVFAVFAAKPAANKAAKPANVKRSPQRLGEALR